MEGRNTKMAIFTFTYKKPFREKTYTFPSDQYFNKEEVAQAAAAEYTNRLGCETTVLECHWAQGRLRRGPRPKSKRKPKETAVVA